MEAFDARSAPGPGRPAAAPCACRRPRLVAAAIVLVALFGACTPAASSSAAGGSGQTSAAETDGSATAPRPAAHLTILAAASLRDVLETAARRYETTHPGAALTLSTDSSAALAAEIEQGAPADLFLSADTKTPQSLVDDGYANAPVRPFARNTLAIVVPASGDGGIRSPADLARPGVRIVAAGDAVPITAYARRLIANLAARAGYPADYAARYESNVVSREDNVKAVLAKVILGEADAGIVYATDAASSTAVRSLPIPEAANVTATYGAVIPGDAADPAGALAFLDWLLGPDGQGILRSAGFLPPAD